MDYIKNRWSTTSNIDATQANQSQAIETSYNSVTFTNAHANAQNPIIIATQHPGQISIIHEVRNTSLKASDMTSPADSFHSVVSAFHNDNSQREGKVNLGFSGSATDMNNQTQHQTTQSEHPQNRWVVGSHESRVPFSYQQFFSYHNCWILPNTCLHISILFRLFAAFSTKVTGAGTGLGAVGISARKSSCSSLSFSRFAFYRWRRCCQLWCKRMSSIGKWFSVT